MYSEDQLLPLSGLQHLLFCERQCALIHIEQIWNENLYTAEGRILHERVDRGGHETRCRVRIEYGLPIRSLSLGLIGKADVVEFHLQKDGIWQPYPVEYKRGRPKKAPWDKVQLCAQAMCLEEMLETQIAEGALFYGKTRRRQRVVFDEALRSETKAAAARDIQISNLRVFCRQQVALNFRSQGQGMLQADMLFQQQSHVVEYPGKVSEFIPGINVHPGVQPAGGALPNAFHQGLQGAGDGSRKQNCQQDGCQNGCQQQDQ